ncbi:hypothetical protein B0T22DRAFT_38418 [Podospora appendiculata]|uniref:Uncharacterized protein n=1 Tax=Podospora appendiculata TaxID=314037 RepID=A0AAE0XH81_9PEZI|nr:hypothetical protein B0T22DRAFT_38418 [Podospora appendiculata]
MAFVLVVFCFPRVILVHAMDGLFSFFLSFFLPSLVISSAEAPLSRTNLAQPSEPGCQGGGAGWVRHPLLTQTDPGSQEDFLLPLVRLQPCSRGIPLVLASRHSPHQLKSKLTQSRRQACSRNEQWRQSVQQGCPYHRIRTSHTESRLSISCAYPVPSRLRVATRPGFHPNGRVLASAFRALIHLPKPRRYEAGAPSQLSHGVTEEHCQPREGGLVARGARFQPR